MSSEYSQQMEIAVGVSLCPNAEGLRYWYMTCRSSLHILPA